jgi:hypothetical protein
MHLKVLQWLGQGNIMPLRLEDNKVYTLFGQIAKHRWMDLEELYKGFKSKEEVEDFLDIKHLGFET